MIATVISFTGALLLGLAGLVAPVLADLTNGWGPGGPGGPPSPVTVPLSDAEATDLLFMREEEKLARDVYLEMYDLWELPVFRNIARAEQAHMNAVGRLIARYGLTDPVGNNPRGVFANPELQAMYDELVARGRQSTAEALQVGIDIETADIADLQDALADVAHSDIARVYGNLLRGSERHLAAFSRYLP